MAFLFSIQSESARPSKESSGSTFVNSAILKKILNLLESIRFNLLARAVNRSRIMQLRHAQNES